MERRNHGTAGHFICARQCCFRLHTSVNGYRISTVGCYHPKGKERQDPEQVGYGRLYETFVFRLGNDGEPESWSEIDSDGYNDERAAEDGHEAMVFKYAQVKP